MQLPYSYQPDDTCPKIPSPSQGPPEDDRPRVVLLKDQVEIYPREVDDPKRTDRRVDLSVNLLWMRMWTWIIGRGVSWVGLDDAGVGRKP